MRRSWEKREKLVGKIIAAIKGLNDRRIGEDRKLKARENLADLLREYGKAHNGIQSMYDTSNVTMQGLQNIVETIRSIKSSDTAGITAFMTDFAHGYSSDEQAYLKEFVLLSLDNMLKMSDNPAGNNAVTAKYELGWHYFDLGEYEKAKKYYEDVLSLVLREDNRSYVDARGILSWTYFDLGIAYKELGEDDKAIDALQKSIPLVDDEWQIGSAQRDLSELFIKKGDFTKAMGAIDGGLKLIEQKAENERIKEIKDEMFFLLQANICCIELGEMKKAKDYASRALKLADKIEMKP